MNKSHVRIPAVGMAALLLAAGAVGCAKGDGAQSKDGAQGKPVTGLRMTPAAAVAKAAANAEQITSLHYRMTGKVPQAGRIEADARMRMKPDLAMSMKTSALDEGADGSVEIRLVKKVMYMGGNAAMAKEMGGKH